MPPPPHNLASIWSDGRLPQRIFFKPIQTIFVFALLIFKSKNFAYIFNVKGLAEPEDELADLAELFVLSVILVLYITKYAASEDWK